MLSAVFVLVAVAAVLGRTVPPEVDELQRLESLLEDAAVEENMVTLGEVRRVARGRPDVTGANSMEDGTNRLDAPATSTGQAAGTGAAMSLKLPGTSKDNLIAGKSTEEVEKKRFTREKPASEDSKTPGGREDRHRHSGGSVVSYPSPHLTFNVPPPQVSLYQQAPIQPPRPPGMNCGSGGCGEGTTIHVQDTHLVSQHVPQSYSATVPFISGYRLTPIVGQKQITLHDWYHGGGSSSTCDQWPGYWQHLYNTGRSAWTAEDLLRPFEDARFFQAPVNQEHDLPEHSEFSTRIDDLRNHIEHLESLRDNVSTPVPT